MKFIDAVYAIRDLQNEMFRHANYKPTEYFAYRSKVYRQPKAGLTYEPMSLTYQPMTLREKGLDDLGGSVITKTPILSNDTDMIEFTDDDAMSPNFLGETCTLAEFIAESVK